MKEGINLALYAWVVIECIAAEVAELRSVPLESRVSEGCGNVGLDKGSALGGYKALKILHKENNIPVVHVFSY